MGHSTPSDTNELRAFHEQFPLTFHFWDLEEQPLLSSIGGAGQTMLVHLTNNGTRDLMLMDIPARDFHFALHFRKGTLRDHDKIILDAPQKGWRLLPRKEPQVDILLIRGPAGYTMAPGDNCILLLHHVRVNSARRTRNTRVALDYRNLRYGDRPLTDVRQATIEVVHQYPPEARENGDTRRRPVPLRIGFAGANTVLAAGGLDETTSTDPNALYVQLSNLADTPIVFRRVVENDDHSSRIMLAFEVQDENEEHAWALGTLSEVAAIEPFLPGWEPIRFVDAERVVWVFTPQKREIELGAGSALLLTINNITTSLPAGPANLHLTLENIPNPDGGFYADQQQTFTVQKSLIYFNHHTGTEDSYPQSYLFVSGGISVGATYAGRPAGENGLIVEGSLGVGTPSPSGRLELGGAQGEVRFGDNMGDNVHHFTSSRDTVFNSVTGEWRFRKLTEYENLSSFSELATITAQGRVHDKTGPVMPVGAMLPFAGATAPGGWILCNGQTLRRTEYSELFDVVGYTYGGSGDSFRVPDLRNRVAVGHNSGEPSFNTLGKQGGEIAHTLTEAEMPSHNHRARQQNNGAHDHDLGTRGFVTVSAFASGEGPGADGSLDDRGITTHEGGGHDHDVGIDRTGGNQAHNNLQPFLTVNYIIKY